MLKRLVLLLLCVVALVPGAAAQTSSPPFGSSLSGLLLPQSPVTLNRRNPVTNGLSLAWVFDMARYSPLYISRGAAPLTLQNGGIVGISPTGMALMPSTIGSPDGAAFSQSGVTYTLPASGTMLAFVRANFSPTDGVAHQLVEIGSGPFFYFSKHSDNNWYFGFAGAGFSPDVRVVAAASGTFNAGGAFVVGGTWEPSLTTLYVKGVSVGTNATALPTFPASGAPFAIASSWNGTGLGTPWGTEIFRDGVHWVMIWDRVLNVSEIQAISANPAQLFSNNNDAILATLTGPSAAPPASRVFFHPAVPW